jgi:hypothetical protein
LSFFFSLSVFLLLPLLVISLPGGTGDELVAAADYEWMRALAVKIDYEKQQLTF